MWRERALKVVLVVVGLLFVAGVYPLMMRQNPPALFRKRFHFPGVGGACRQPHCVNANSTTGWAWNVSGGDIERYQTETGSFQRHGIGDRTCNGKRCRVREYIAAGVGGRSLRSRIGIASPLSRP
jgi:hypothetical protein